MTRDRVTRATSSVSPSKKVKLKKEYFIIAALCIVVSQAEQQKTGARGLRGLEKLEPVCPFQDVDVTEWVSCRPHDFASSGSRFDLAWHTTGNTWLFKYDGNDYVSGSSLSGPDFYEQDITNKIIGLLQREAGLLRGPGVRAADGHCVGTQEGDVWYLDVGANIGVHAVQVASAGWPTVAVEATPSTAMRLSCSKLINQLPHLQVVNAAVFDQSGVNICLQHFPDNEGANSLVVGDQGDQPCGKDSEYAVSTVRLDELLSPSTWRPANWRRKLQKDPASGNGFAFQPLSVGPTVMKMDVEGSEWLALEGYKSIMGTLHKPKFLFFELLSWFLAEKGRDSNLGNVMLRMIDWGYKSYMTNGTEVTRKEIEAYAATSNNWDKFPKQENPYNYIFVREDVPIPADLFN